jgi:D-alanyl-D-alanine carboxypeptidase/D-alanyl-D-alanine-endopeptidase (penicillin-binding protein 4)
MRTRLLVFAAVGLLSAACIRSETVRYIPAPSSMSPEASTAPAGYEPAPGVGSILAAEEPLKGLVERIHAYFEDPMFANAYWGAVIQSLDTGKIWYERNANKLFMPASNQKILTTSAALSVLGPDFRFKTTVAHTGGIEGNTLAGDLVVFGTGDPTFYERWLDDSRDVFREWAGQLKDKGIRRITGNVVGDDNAWDDENVGNGWALDNLDAWYSAPYSALQLNEDYIDFNIVPPAAVDGEVRIVPNVPSNYYTIENNLTAVAEGRASVSVSRKYGTNHFVFNGTVVAGSDAFERSPSIWNPTLFYVTVLKEVLEEEGINVDGEARDCDDLPGWNASPDGLPTLIVHESPRLADILTMLMKRSQNLYAETMVHTLGWNENGKGTFRGGREVVQRVLADFGVDPEGYRYMDGSGLTRYNFVSPRQVTDILIGMDKGPYREIWFEALPIAGVDGTLRNRMKGTPAEGNVHAKTGTISNVRGLSGYVTTADGERIVFSFLVNAHLRSSRDTETVTDGVLALIAGFSRNASGENAPAGN